MKLTQFKRWMSKQKSYNQKYKLKSIKKSTRELDHTGKYLFLISAKNLCTILKFVAKNACVTETALIVDDLFIKQISKKLLITSKRNKKILENCEVMVTQKFKDSVMKLVKITKPSQSELDELNSVLPIKIISCKICNKKFKEMKALEQHMENIHKLESDSETESEGIPELEIDDIKEDPDFVPIQPRVAIHEYKSFDSSANDVNYPSSTTTQEQPFTVNFIREEDKNEFKCRICSYCVSSRGFLNRHILGLHILNVYKCYKCKVVFEYKQKFLNHLNLAHKKNEKEEEFKSSLCDPDSYTLFHCCFCKYSSLNRETVVEHMLGEHYDEFEMDDPDKPDENRRTSSPDSLEELLLPENRAKLLGFTQSQSPLKKRRTLNDPEFPFRCARCKRRFSRKYWLKDHVCAERTSNEEESTPAKVPKTLNVVNGFYHCTHPRCSQVFTNKVLFDVHLAMDHIK